MSRIVLVHGAWAGAWEFAEISRDLTAAGHQVSAPDLPGHGADKTPVAQVTMESYVDRIVETVGAAGGPVVLVGHSLAGSVISQVAERIPALIDRLVYVCAFLPKDGDTPLGLMQSDAEGQLLPKIIYSSDQSFATIAEADIREIFLHDVADPARAAQLASHYVTEQATEPFMVPATLTTAAFGSVPKIYLRASLDKVMSLALQDKMIGHWPVARVLTLESGHFPMMSKPAQLVAAINQAATDPAINA